MLIYRSKIVNIKLENRLNMKKHEIKNQKKNIK